MKMEGTSVNVKILAGVIAASLYLSVASAQLVEVPIGHHRQGPARSTINNRIQATSPVNLPFWDDFSYTDILTYPQENLWQFGKSVYLNNGTAIRPPTKNVVTFDGVDSIGKPYNVNDILAKGFADKLVSQPIRMDLVDPALRGTVYLSFYYQVKGNGESPDPGDQLILSYKNSSGAWETMYTVDNDQSQATDAFFQVIVPVADDRFYHDAFQFRLRNFSRLSGPYDTWNVDYIYLNTSRSLSDTSYPDRSVSTPLTSMFVDYYAIPARHFLQNPAANLQKPSLDLYNLKSGNLQPFDYSTKAVFKTRVNKVVTTKTVILDVAQDPGSLLTGLQYLNVTLNKIPAPSDFDPLADSIGISLKYNMAVKDNVPIPGGDYDPARYSPIDFRYNDSIQSSYVLRNYYAYDDGTAEYGAGLSQAGSYLAIKFNLKSSQPDTLVAVDIYFPEFGDNTSQSLAFQVRTDLSDATAPPIWQELIVVDRKTQNTFVRYNLSKYAVLSGTFYLGWKQLNNVTLPVGLDKNTDNGSKLYYSTTGQWIQNTTIKGSLMVRPIFGGGKGEGIVTGIEPGIRRQPIYPNPASRICYLPGDAESVTVADITGRYIETSIQYLGSEQSVTFLSPVSGLVIVRYIASGKLYVEKLMVRAE